MELNDIPDKALSECKGYTLFKPGEWNEQCSEALVNGEWIVARNDVDTYINNWRRVPSELLVDGTEYPLVQGLKRILTSQPIEELQREFEELNSLYTNSPTIEEIMFWNNIPF